MLSRYFKVVLQHPRWVLFCVAFLVALAATALPNFKLDASADSLTLENDADLDYFRKTFSHYQAGDFLIVTYTPNTDLFSNESLQTLEQLSNDLAALPRVSSVTNMLNVPLLYSPKISLSDLAKEPRTLLTKGVDREQAKKEFLNSPVYRDMLLSSDMGTTAVLVNLAVDNEFLRLAEARNQLRWQQSERDLSQAEEQELTRVSAEFLAYRTAAAEKDKARVAKVRAIVDNYRDSAQMFVGGPTMITADMIDFIRSDLKVFGASLLLLIILFLAILFRQWRFVILPLFSCLATLVLMLGWLSWIDWRLTVISSNFVALLLIMSLAISVHLVSRFREQMYSHPDLNRIQLVEAMVKHMARPCLYTVLTTVVAFMSLVVSGIRPVIDFGWMMTIGMVLGFVLVFIILPAGLVLWPDADKQDSNKPKVQQSPALTLKFASIVERYGTSILLASVLLAITAFYGISQLQVDNRFIDYFHKNTEIYRGTSVIDQRLGGTMPLEILLDYGVPTKDELSDEDFGDEGFGDEDFDEGFGEESSQLNSYWLRNVGLSRIDSLHRYLESLPEVGKVQSLAILYQVSSDINGAALNDFELAVMNNKLSDEVSDVLIKPYLFIDGDLEQSRISMRLIESSPELDRMTLVAKIRDHAINELGFSANEIRFSGLLVLYNNMLNSLFDSQIKTLGAVFFAIMLMFMLLFRSLALAVVAIIPNLLAAFTVLGGMGLAGIPLDMMTITIAAITIGIAVDHEIHYITRFRSELAKDGDYIASMYRAHGSIGRVLYYTALIITLGFSILSLSEFVPSIYFGLLTAGSMLIATLASLMLLPKLILMFKPFGKL